MPENNLIKSITPHNCPACGMAIYVESQMVPSTVSSLFTAADVEEAKEDCLEKISGLVIDEEKKDAVVKWINDPETVFGKEEVENIISSLLTSKG
jgi:hypothetical protein